MATAKKLPSGNYRALVYIGTVDGKRQYKSFTDPDKWTAEHMASAFRTEQQAALAPESMTVGQAIDRYIESKDAILSPATVRGYKRVRRCDLQGIMALPLAKVTPEHVQLAVNQDALTKSPKTVRNAHGLIVAALKAYHPGLRLDTTLPQKTKPKIYIPTEAEIVALLKAASGTHMDIPVLLGAYLGLRRSELCALTIDDIDTKTKSLSIRKAMVLSVDDEWVVKPPKSYSGFRTIPLPDFLYDKITALGLPPGARLVEAHPNMITNRFEALQRTALGSVKFRFHDLRHYNASVMLAKNVPNRYAQERLGHATDNMLKTVYQHLFQEKQKEVSDTLNTYFTSIMQHEMQHDPAET